MPPISQLRTTQSFQDVLTRTAFGEDKVDTIEPGEEFAPSADIDEIPARLRRRSGQVKPIAKKKTFGEDISDAHLFFWCLVIILSGFYFMFWREEKFTVGFCGVPQPERKFRLDSVVDISVSMADVINESYPNDWRSTFVNYIRPTCTPCPPHAQCHPRLEMSCNDDFIYKPHPFRLNGLVPVVGECIPDTEKQRRIAIVAERAMRVLREKAARVECEAETPTGMMERDIKAELLKYKSGTLSDEEFDALFEAAIGEVEKREEVSITSAEDAGPGSKYVNPIFYSDID
jgi:Man1-Src1p-C-terminal domain